MDRICFERLKRFAITRFVPSTWSLSLSPPLFLSPYFPLFEIEETSIRVTTNPLPRIRNHPLLTLLPAIRPIVLPAVRTGSAHVVKLLEADVPRQPLGRVAAAVDGDAGVAELLDVVGGGAGNHEAAPLVARAAVHFDRALDVGEAGSAGGFAPLCVFGVLVGLVGLGRGGEGGRLTSPGSARVRIAARRVRRRRVRVWNLILVMMIGFGGGGWWWWC